MREVLGAVMDQVCVEKRVDIHTNAATEETCTKDLRGMAHCLFCVSSPHTGQPEPRPTALITYTSPHLYGQHRGIVRIREAGCG